MPKLKDVAIAHYKVFCGAVFMVGAVSGAASQVVFTDQFEKHTAEMTKAVNVNNAEIRKIHVEKDIERYNRLYEAFNEPSDKRKLESLNRELILLEQKINS